MSPDDVAFTRVWWARTVADHAKLERWLIKLEGTERQGYEDNRWAAAQFAQGNVAVEQILHATGNDEMRHADLLASLLDQRAPDWRDAKPPESTYWEDMDAHIFDLPTCAAVFHLGEKLASERFEVLLEHPATPDDVRTFLASALPDEQHHTRIFAKLAGPEAIEKMTVIHLAAVDRLKGRTPVMAETV